MKHSLWSTKLQDADGSVLWAVTEHRTLTWHVSRNLFLLADDKKAKLRTVESRAQRHGSTQSVLGANLDSKQAHNIVLQDNPGAERPQLPTTI